MLGRLRAAWDASYLPSRVGLQYITNHRSHGLWREGEIPRLEDANSHASPGQHFIEGLARGIDVMVEVLTTSDSAHPIGPQGIGDDGASDRFGNKGL